MKITVITSSTKKAENQNLITLKIKNDIELKHIYYNIQRSN